MFFLFVGSDLKIIFDFAFVKNKNREKIYTSGEKKISGWRSVERNVFKRYFQFVRVNFKAHRLAIKTINAISRAGIVRRSM